MWCVIDCKDGRQRAFTRVDGKVTSLISYPRIIMEDYLGRPLEPDEIVHHIDHDPSNNKLENLELEILEQHTRLHRVRYFNKFVKCIWCGQEFLWKGKSQSEFIRNMTRSKNKSFFRSGPFCSRRCSGIYGNSIQNGYCDPIDNSNILKVHFPDWKYNL